MNECLKLKIIYIIYRLIPKLECTNLISTEIKILNTKPKIIQTWRTICLQWVNERNGRILEIKKNGIKLSIKVEHGQLKLRPYFLPWVSKNRRYVSTIQSLFLIVLTWILLFFYLKLDFSLLKIEIEIGKKNNVTR